MTILDPKIDYIEVGIYNKKDESVGLLSSLDTIGNSIMIVPKAIADAAFLNLTHFTITFVRTAYERKHEEYFFTESVEDQKEAVSVLKSLIEILKEGKRCTASGYIHVDTYMRVPNDYIHTRVAKCCVTAPATSVVGGRTNLYGCNVPNGTNPGGTGTTTVHKPYVAPSKLVFIKRSSVLPKKAELKALEKLINSGEYGVILPDTTALDEEVKTETNSNPIYNDDTYEGMYGGY
ncbi:hypothetical protein JZU46_00965 [bacterium]|nr:hypothetical protein [bacterium]